MGRNPGRIGIRFTLFWALFFASVIMPGAGDDGDGACEAMVQPTDGLVFEGELATLTIAVTLGCCMDKDPQQVTRWDSTVREWGVDWVSTLLLSICFPPPSFPPSHPPTLFQHHSSVFPSLPFS
jgi:hypothetical protein